MNSALVALIGIVWLVLAYRIYGRFIEKRIIKPDDKLKTPAHALQDGIDYYPAKQLVLFGHHFASIAGAGPIIGPVIAASAFGWGGTALWILLGVVLIGAVHDYTTLVVSIRHKGHSIPEVTRSIVGDKARVLFLVFVWITLLFVIAVFTLAAAKSFIADPRIVIPALGLIPISMIFGWVVNRKGMPLLLGTSVALVLLAGLFALGLSTPLALPFDRETNMQVWIVILLFYGSAAAVLPVWILLQPRDYVAYWILVAGMVLGFSGLFISAKPITAPFIANTVSDSQGPIWPMLFILVACGAVSGFHSLVSSGTTAKQLDRETHAKPVAFGAMLTEGALALLALLAVTAGLGSGDGTAGNELPPLAAYLGKDGGGPIAAFADGFGGFTDSFMPGYGALFGMIMLNAFVLTTLDTSVRLTRFITSELIGDTVAIFKNRYVTTIFVALLAYGIASTGSEKTLWPMFGAANQLVAALAMIVVSVYLAQKKRPTLYTLLPAVFMLITTEAALIWKGYSYLTADEPNYTLVVASLLLFVLAIYVGICGVKAYSAPSPAAEPREEPSS